MFHVGEYMQLLHNVTPEHEWEEEQGIKDPM